MTTDAIFGLNQFETSLKPLANKKKRKQFIIKESIILGVSYE